MPYDAPVGRTREIIEICRKVWRRERLEYEGRHYTIPLPPDQGTGLGKPLKLINHPVRDRIPIVVAALGPEERGAGRRAGRGLAADLLLPGEGGVGVGRGPGRRAGQARPVARPARRGAGQAALAIGDDVTGLLDLGRPLLALYIGGMGAKGRNFYNDLVAKYGYEAEAAAIQDAYLDGRKDEAAALVPAVAAGGNLADRAAGRTWPSGWRRSASPA